MEHEADVRRFMLRVGQLGLATPDYVWILPDFVRDMNRSELWLDYGSGASSKSAAEMEDDSDGRNEEAKKAFKHSLMVRFGAASRRGKRHN